MIRRHHPLLVVAAMVVLSISAVACSSDTSPSSCDELRAELARVAKPIDVQQWNDDIEKLADEKTEELRLRDEIAARCD